MTSHTEKDPLHSQALESTTSSSRYPSLDMTDLVSNLFPDDPNSPRSPASADPPPVEETLISIPGAILHLIDKQQSIELARGDLSIIRLRQGDSAIAILARISDSVQWPLALDSAAVKLDHSHYFFSLRVPDGSDDLLNYGLTFASESQEDGIEELDRILETCTGFSVQNVDEKEQSEVLEVMVEGEKEERSAAYWTTLAPNVEDYSSLLAKAIAAGSGQLVRGILWCGDVTVDRLNKGNDMLTKKMGPSAQPAEISPEAMMRMERVKKMTEMSEKVVTGILSGVVKVSGYFAGSIVNSKAGKKILGLLPGEIVLASLEGFDKICDAVEEAGKNVLSTSSVVTTGLVSQRYGDQAGEFTNQGLESAGHAIGTAWAVFKIRKALNPKSSLKPTTLAKTAAEAAAAEMKGKMANRGLN